MSAKLHTPRRILDCENILVMAIINVTPDSFSDGGAFMQIDDAVRQIDKAINDGADIIDIGGESTRPGSKRVATEDEAARVLPVIEAVAKRHDIAISVDTSKSEIAARALDAGAEIVNDISGLRFDPYTADVAASHSAGLILMHSRGDFENMHAQPPVDDVFTEVISGLRAGINTAFSHGVKPHSIALDPGIGFGKTAEQNLDLLANLGKIAERFPEYPLLIGASRKSFIGRYAAEADAASRLGGSLAAAALAVWNGAKIIRAHDVAETVQAVRIAKAASELADYSI